jgi:UDP-perosamine 4-acetyltransferase
MNNLLIIGAGGHAKVVLDCAYQQRVFDSFFVVDDDKNKWGNKLLNCDIQPLESFKSNNNYKFTCAIGHDQIRKQFFERYQSLGLKAANIIHPTAYISPFASIGDGVMVMRGVTIHPDAVIGNNVILNTSSIIEHDVKIDDHVQVSPGAIICGNVKVGELSFIGAGAVVKQGVTIGNNCIIAAGAVVVKNVMDGQLVKGVPAN